MWAGWRPSEGAMGGVLVSGRFSRACSGGACVCRVRVTKTELVCWRGKNTPLGHVAVGRTHQNDRRARGTREACGKEHRVRKSCSLSEAAPRAFACARFSGHGRRAAAAACGHVHRRPHRYPPRVPPSPRCSAQPLRRTGAAEKLWKPFAPPRGGCGGSRWELAPCAMEALMARLGHCTLASKSSSVLHALWPLRAGDGGDLLKVLV